MPAVKYTAEFISANGASSSPRKLSDALEKMSKAIEEIPDKVISKIPKSFRSGIVALLSKYWRQNFVDQLGWENPQLTSGYAAEKTAMYRRGDTFKIGSIGTFPIAHAGDVFGQRTDTLLRHMSQPSSIEALEYLGRLGEGDASGIDLTIQVRLKHESFNGGTIRYVGGDTSKGSKNGGRNSLIMFSNRITPPASEISALIALTQQQRDRISKTVENIYGDTVRSVILTEFNEVFS